MRLSKDLIFNIECGIGDFEETIKLVMPLIDSLCDETALGLDVKKNTKKYWQCIECGTFFTKDSDKRFIFEQTLEMGVTLSGGATCSTCGSRYNADEIFAGKYDIYSPDTIIDEMVANQTEVTFDKEMKLYFFRNNVIIGPAVTYWFEKSKEKVTANPRCEPKKWWKFWE